MIQLMRDLQRQNSPDYQEFPREIMRGWVWPIANTSMPSLTPQSGLSLLFFILSLLGNLTYGGSVSLLWSSPSSYIDASKILFHSITEGYILTNLPWLIGSLGTMGEDTLIFVQFHLYAR